MSRSTGIAPKGGYNSICFDYFGPQTAGAVVLGYDDPSAGTAWISLDHTAHALSLNLVKEYVAGNGVTIETSAGIGVLVKDGSVRLQSAAWLASRNNGNSADVQLIRANSSDKGELDPTAFTMSDFSGSIAYSAAGSMTLTSVSTSYARYNQLGGMVFFDFAFSGTIGGTPSDHVILSLPVAAGSGHGTWSTCYASPSASATRIGLTNVGGSSLNVYRPDFSNYSAGAFEARGQVIYFI